MKSLYQIEQELINIYDELEENGGELTEELDEKLTLTEDNLAEKIDNYCNLITLTNSDVECCKNEKDRINTIQKTKKNLVTRLKNALLNAIVTFGTHNKNGNASFQTATHKLSTKNNIGCEYDAERVTTLITHLKTYISELRRNGIVATGPDISLEGMMAAINAIVRAEKGEDYEPYSVNDLNYINFEISKTITVANMFCGQYDWTFDAIITPDINFEGTIDDKGLTDYLKGYKELGLEPKTTIGHLIKKTSLVIK